MKKCSESSREVLISELRDMIAEARTNAKQWASSVEENFWNRKLSEYNEAGAKRRFRKRQYTMKEVKEREFGQAQFGCLSYIFEQARTEQDVGRLNVLDRLCTDAFTGKTIQLSADDNNLISYYLEKRYTR